MGLAEAAGEDECAFQCGCAMLAFLERALSHVPAHPLLSMLRHRLSESQAERGDLRSARKMAGLSAGTQSGLEVASTW